MTTPDGIDTLEQMVERLRADLQLARDRAAIAESGRSVLQANVIALHDTVHDLRAENARLRAEAKDAKRLRADDLANLAAVHAALFRALGLKGCGANTPPLDCIRMLVDRHASDLARLTVDAAAECGRLRAERDGLLAAVELTIGAIPSPADPGCDCADCKACRALRAAVAACAPEVNP